MRKKILSLIWLQFSAVFHKYMAICALERQRSSTFMLTDCLGSVSVSTICAIFKNDTGGEVHRFHSAVLLWPPTEKCFLYYALFVGSLKTSIKYPTQTKQQKCRSIFNVSLKLFHSWLTLETITIHQQKRINKLWSRM